MKLSISVTDKVWNDAVAMAGIDHDNVSPSALVRIALRDYVEAETKRQAEIHGGFEKAVSFS